jgi:septal ring factor EnvC (AmiA/AmiB activator)
MNIERIFDLERRLNRERTTIRLIKDLKESLEAKVYAQDKTIKQLETELKSTKEELVELNRCSAKKDTQLESTVV